MKSLFFLSMIIYGTYSIQFYFELEPGTSQCYIDELPANMLLYGQAACKNGGVDFTISQVIEDKEQVLDDAQEVKQFAFHHVTDADSKIRMCFESIEYKDPVRVFFKYDAGSETHDFDYIAYKAQGLQLNQTIFDMEHLQQDISRQQQMLAEKEIQRNIGFQDVSSKIIGFGAITFSMLLIIAACQVIYVKRFFLYKKLN